MTLMSLSADCVPTCHTFNFKPWCVSNRQGEGHEIKGFPFSFLSRLPNLTFHTLHCKYAVYTNPNHSFSAVLTQRLCDVRVIPKYQTRINNYVIILSDTLFCKSCQMSGWATNKQINKQVEMNAVPKSHFTGWFVSTAVNVRPWLEKRLNSSTWVLNNMGPKLNVLSRNLRDTERRGSCRLFLE